MGVPDKHDPRSFVHYEKVAKDGTVVAVVEIADGALPPVDDFTYRQILPAVDGNDQ